MKFVSFLLLLVLCFVNVNQGMATSTSAVVIQIRGEVDLVMARYVERAIDLAVQSGARAVVIDIDTPGGRVDAALDISKAIMRTELPTIAVVTGQAWSAGALIALSARNLYMFPGSTIGAAEPIPATEKTVSAWRSAMEGAAESNGRDGRLAAAMVDRDIEIPGVIERGKLLSLSSQPAVELGLADGIVVDLAQAVRDSDLGQVSFSVVGVSATERLVRALTGPVVSVVLLTLGLAGIIIEITTVGFGVAGVVGILSLGLYFGSSIISGQATGLVLLLFVLGIGLLSLEAFIPGFGVAGITGILVIVGSIILAAGSTQAGLQAVTLSLIASLLLLFLAWRLMVRRKLFDRVSLRARSTAEEGYLAGPKDMSLIGMVGSTVTPLRPAGVVEISSGRLSVVTEGGFIPSGVAVRITKVEGHRIVVALLNQSEGE